jgi:anti-sigma regulatory factor (Ser/Thr protein kinase)
MNRDTSHVRLLPSTGAHAKPCLLLTDGDGTVSHLADRIEDVQIGRAERVLEWAREAVENPGLSVGELGVLTVQLAEALHDALLIAECRRARIGTAERPVPPPLGGEPEVDGTPGLFPTPVEVEAFALALLTLPGHDLASAGTARRHVRATARSLGLPPGTADDLETIAGELVANALEHSGSHAITLTCALSARSAAISVTDEGRGIVAVAPPAPPGPEQEHGRGLLITDALADRWGTRRTSGGLTVWAEVTLQSRESAQ